MEQCIIDLGEDYNDVKSIHALINSKNIEIQKENDQVLQHMVQMNQHIYSYKHQIEALEGEKMNCSN